MHLNNFVEIIRGKLRNTPCISSINKVTSSVEKVKVGDAFVARNASDIPLAVSNGAYAIIAQECVDIGDDEIAWILVDNIQDSLLRYAKIMQLMENIEIFFCTTDTLIIAKSMLGIGIARGVYELLEALEHKIILIDFEILSLHVSPFLHSSQACKIIEQGMFESTIEYNGKAHNIAIPSIFLRNLQDIAFFCAAKHINCYFRNVPELMPIFLHAYGAKQSMRCVYATKNPHILQKYIEFFTSASWGKAMLLTNSERNSTIQSQCYCSYGDIMRALRDDRVHFFIIFGMELDELKDRFIDTYTEQNLF